jgi:hypothetical protein
MSREQEQAATQSIERLYEGITNVWRQGGRQVTPEDLAGVVSTYYQMGDTHFVIGPVKKWLSQQEWYRPPE